MNDGTVSFLCPQPKVKSQAQEIVTELVSCVSKDAAGLKLLIKQMQDLWATAQTLPATMSEIGKQCSKHGDTESKANKEPRKSTCVPIYLRESVRSFRECAERTWRLMLLCYAR